MTEKENKTKCDCGGKLKSIAQNDVENHQCEICGNKYIIYYPVR